MPNRREAITLRDSSGKPVQAIKITSQIEETGLRASTRSYTDGMVRYCLANGSSNLNKTAEGFVVVATGELLTE